MNLTKNRSTQYVLLSLVIAIQVLLMLYFGSKKENFHMDEICTYGLSNSYYKPLPCDTEQWLNKSYFDEYLETGDNDRFKYDSVYYNQTRDVHPPLYYFIFHTLCSLLPFIFSKWTGIVLNIVFFIVCTIILFFLSKNLLNNYWLALLTCTMWGFSIGAITSIVYIRMYVLLTLFTILSCYLYVRLLEHKTFTFKILIPIIITTYLGLMTQYYFVIFTFFIAAILLIYLIIKKQFKDVFKFSFSILLSFILAIISFPAAIKHIFKSSRGIEASKNFMLVNKTITNIFRYISIVNDSLFAGILFLILLYITTIIIIRTLLGLNCKFDEEKKFKFLMLALPSIFYCLLIAKISPYQSARYICAVFPLIILCFIYVCRYIVSLFTNKAALINIIIAMVVFIITTLGFLTQNIDYLYEGDSKIIRKSKEYSNIDCLFISDAAWKTVDCMMTIKNFDNIYLNIIDKDNLSNEFNNSIGHHNKIIVYLENYNVNEEKLMQCIQYVKNITKLTNHDKLYNSGSFNVYLFS